MMARWMLYLTEGSMHPNLSRVIRCVSWTQSASASALVTRSGVPQNAVEVFVVGRAAWFVRSYSNETCLQLDMQSILPGGRRRAWGKSRLVEVGTSSDVSYPAPVRQGKAKCPEVGELAQGGIIHDGTPATQAELDHL